MEAEQTPQEQEFESKQNDSVSTDSALLTEKTNKTRRLKLILTALVLLGVIFAAVTLFFVVQKPDMNGAAEVADGYKKYTDELYTIAYPESWTVYNVDDSGVELPSLLIIPAEANWLFRQATSTTLESSYQVTQKLEEQNHQYITMGGTFSYYPYVPPEQRHDFFEQLIREWEGTEGTTETSAEIITVNGRVTALYTFSHAGRIIEFATWFATPDDHGRDTGSETILVRLQYNAPDTQHNPELLPQLLQSADDSIIASYLKNTPIPEETDVTGAVQAETLFASTDSAIVGAAVHRAGSKVILGEFSNRATGEFSTTLQQLDRHSRELEHVNLSPFTSQSEIDIDGYRKQQIFSPDGSKIVLHASVGSNSTNVEYAGFEGFAIFDLTHNELYKLIPTKTHRYVQSFRTANGLSGGYSNLYGWANDQEIIYTCNTDRANITSETDPGTYADRFITLEEVDYCVVDIETLELRTPPKSEMVQSTFTSKMPEQPATPFFTSKTGACTSTKSGACLRVTRGTVTLERDGEVLTVAEGDYSGFVGWESDAALYLILNEYTVNGQRSELLKIDI